MLSNLSAYIGSINVIHLELNWWRLVASLLLPVFSATLLQFAWGKRKLLSVWLDNSDLFMVFSFQICYRSRLGVSGRFIPYVKPPQSFIWCRTVAFAYLRMFARLGCIFNYILRGSHTNWSHTFPYTRSRLLFLGREFCFWTLQTPRCILG